MTSHCLKIGRVNPHPWPLPREFHTPDLSVVPLTMDLLARDTEAFVSSPRAIEAHSAELWRTDGFTEEDNLPLLSEHEREHASGAAFACSLLSPDASRELGCAYLRPMSAYAARTGTLLAEAHADSAILTFWAIDDTGSRPPGVVILGHLRDWVAEWGAAPAVLRFLGRRERDRERGAISRVAGTRGVRTISALPLVRGVVSVSSR
ncbi:hypothetical protein [Nocardioides sp. B-3]|uniref:hypothetical protein n=1 Tax=Nocardioides sp. B-3 TaxID=2895565 RepID=UPI00215277CA|nr:hypothetical protein [Nocardioides sp. B-3]UUZ61913.1 hypothetical protein LP418_25800 [Nocardioides sp. B-3]